MTNDIRIEGETVYVRLDVEHEMKVDVHSWHKLRMGALLWRRSERGYGYAWRSCTILAHRMVMNAKRGQQVEHRDQDKLNNRRDNLRFSTQSQNLMNQKARSRHGYKGISFCRGMWAVALRFEGKRYYAGRFKEPLRAAKAYDRAALALAGEFASLNFEQDRASYRPKMPTEMQKRPRAATPELETISVSAPPASL